MYVSRGGKRYWYKVTEGVLEKGGNVGVSVLERRGGGS